MSRLFGGKSETIINNPAPPAPAPTVDDAAKMREMRDNVLKRKGRAASLLTGPQGAGVPSVTVKTLTGQ